MFKKKENDNFFTLLINHATLTRDTVAALCAYCHEPTEANGDTVKAAEVAADDARKVLVSEIHKSFITPIDREDLFRLSSCIDDLADYAWTTVKELRIYNITPDQSLTVLAETLLQMANLLLESVKCIESKSSQASEIACKVKKMENTVSQLFHESIARLFEQDDLRNILKYREIYIHMNHAADKGDAAADILLDALVKQ